VTNAVTIVLPWPPSVNGYWRSFNNRQIISRRGREYRDEVFAIIVGLGSPSVGDGDLEVWEEFHPPTLRRYDLDNFRKAHRDALTHAGVWGDDSQIAEDHGKKCAKDKDNPRVVVRIERKG
jgi:crossover junction endodeoxyribonuclease RusA